ncbi:sensor histidine kinase [Amycolatopsis anabasis]|uniref:sensor histidine kinase n=1 Tax=Amycolatopsis anabasis TaxID=1840409 RepID=UPI00131DCD4B|nr:sensor domain-containing protein [Amycolatopsis anabasis]
MTLNLGHRLAGARDAAGYCLASFGTGLACMLALPVLLYSAVLCLVGVGLVLLPPELRLLGRIADAERRLSGRWLGRTIPLPPRRARRLRELLAAPATARDLRWVPVNMIIGPVLGLIGVTLALLPLGALAAVLAWWAFPADAPIQVMGVPVDSWASAAYAGIPMVLVTAALALVLPRWLASASAWVNAALLAPSAKEELAERVENLRESRAGAVDAHGAELRRIERDLHDGTQARLVSIAMRLGLAERQLDRDPQAVATLLAEARAGAEDAMTELRDVLRTMYPPILADRGLDGALSAVAARCAVPVELEVGDLGELAAPVEAAAYFVVTEALTNVVKHSGAGSARVTVRRDTDTLRVEITDDGRGGADEGGGTGIAGMRRRIAALDGTLWVDSPPGGPTRILVECPCGS